MPAHRSKVEHMARTLSRAAVVLLVLFLGATIGAIQYVDSELNGEATLFRYLLVMATAGPLLVASVIAWVGSYAIRAMGRVRGTLVDAMLRDIREELGEVPPPPPRSPELTRVDR